MEQGMSLDDIELITAGDRLIELTQEMGVAGIRPVHRLELETKVIAGGFRIKRALQCQNRLIEQEIARHARLSDRCRSPPPKQRTARVLYRAHFLFVYRIRSATPDQPTQSLHLR